MNGRRGRWSPPANGTSRAKLVPWAHCRAQVGAQVAGAATAGDIRSLGRSNRAIRAQVTKSICALYIRTSKGINDRSGTGAQIFRGRRLHVASHGLFPHVATPDMRRVRLICKKVCPCARSSRSKVGTIPSWLAEVTAGAANGATRSESVLQSVLAVQIAAQIASQAAAAYCRRSNAINLAISRVCSEQIQHRLKSAIWEHKCSSEYIDSAAQYRRTDYFGLAPLCPCHATVSAGRGLGIIGCDVDARNRRNLY